MAQIDEKRRKPRVPIDRMATEIEIGGQTVPVHVHDLSEQGLRLSVSSGVSLDRDDELRIAVGKISPNIRARVRWVKPDPDDPEHLQAGVEFESFLLETPQEDEIHDLLETWREVSHTYSIYESFLHILETLDLEIVDGHIDDISDAVYSTMVWLDQRLGPVNLWGVLQHEGHTEACQLLVERHPTPTLDFDERHRRVREVVANGVTGWHDGLAYLYGDAVVMEYLGRKSAQIDLLQKLTVLLGRRVQFWTKLLIKNIALHLLGDEVGRHAGK